MHAPTSPSRRRAFSLVELVVVIVVLGILAAIGIVSYQQVVTASQDKAARLELTAVAREASALAVADGRSVWEQDDFVAALADVSSSAPASGPGTGAAGPGLALVYTTPGAADSSSMEHGKVSLSRAGERAGLAMATAGGRCALARVTLPTHVTAWTVGNVNGSCRGSTALTKNPGDDVAPTDPVSGFTPDAPTALTATKTDAGVVLTWAASPGSTGSTVYRSVNGGEFTALAGPLGTTAYTDTTATTAGTVFAYEVTAVGDNESLLSKPATVSTAPSAPGPVTVQTSGTDVTVSWPAVDGADGYRIYKDGAFFGQVVGAATTSATDSLPAGATATYTVAAYSAAGEGSQSSPATTAAIPSAPTGAAFTLASNLTSVVLTWDQSATATGYRIYRDGTLVKTIADGTVTTATITQATGTTSTWTVTATNGAGESDPSTGLVATTRPALPASLSLTAATTGMTITWGDAAGATSYRVERSTVSTTTGFSTVGTPTSPSFADTGLAAGTTYYYRVWAVNAVGESSSGRTGSLATLPVAPTGLSVSVAATQVSVYPQATVTWAVPAGTPKGYSLDVSTSSAFDTSWYSTSPTTNATTASPFQVSSSTTYYVRLAIKNSNGVAGPWATTTFTTPAQLAQPGAVSPSWDRTGLPSGSIKISVGAVGGASQYVGFRCSTNNASSCVYSQTWSSTPSVTFTGQPVGTWTYGVAGWNAATGIGVIRVVPSAIVQ